MPHDLNGRELKIGDRVMVECEIISLGTTEEACNCTAVPVEKPVGSSYIPHIVLNTGQVFKMYATGVVPDAPSECPVVKVKHPGGRVVPG